MLILILVAFAVAAPIGQEHQAQYKAARETPKGRECYAYAIKNVRAGPTLQVIQDELSLFDACMAK